MPSMILPRTTQRLISAAMIMCLMLGLSGCRAWRDASQLPQYRLLRRPHIGATDKALYRKTDQQVSIFRTIQGIPFHEDLSSRVRSQQQGLAHKVARVPAGLVQAAYLIAATPLLLLASAFALPVWYESERDATVFVTPRYWEEYPWYWVTRPLWFFDVLFHDIPFLMVAWPGAALRGGPPDWKDEVELDPFDMP